MSSKAVRVWEHRGNRDLYTGIERTVYDRKGHEMQVDHVLEIQLLNYAWEEGVARNPALPPACNLRSSKSRAITAQQANDIGNLNVTMREINNKKRGPFTRWINKYKSNGGAESTAALPLDDMIRASAEVDSTPQMHAMIDTGIWDRIKRSVVTTYDGLADSATLDRAIASGQLRGEHVLAFEAYLDTINAMITRMDIA